ncbi:LytR/AlgR family response regulator transcription factor [Microbulbifer sp. ZKSA002]|uniref:LytR/AlgR family response regulator transcription factor n=1 Tax=Microbulbifer sp. ZKSA002 TaxID=3243388 RepID=UPI004039D086
MNILLIEDEPLTAGKLKNYILKYNSQAKILGPLDKVEKVRRFFLEEIELDLIFSDIELLDGPVFHVLNEIDLPCPIIYTTAHDSYWMNAFQNMGIEYLLKPYSYKRFTGAMLSFEQLKSSFSNKTYAKEEPAVGAGFRYRFLLRKGGCVEVLWVEDIICLRAEQGIIVAHDKKGMTHSLVQQSVTDLESQLNPQKFIRINRSDIVNIQYVQRFEAYGKDTLAIHLSGLNEPLITSKTRSSAFRRWLDS